MLPLESLERSFRCCPAVVSKECNRLQLLYHADLALPLRKSFMAFISWVFMSIPGYPCRLRVYLYVDTWLSTQLAERHGSPLDGHHFSEAAIRKDGCRQLKSKSSRLFRNCPKRSDSRGEAASLVPFMFCGRRPLRSKPYSIPSFPLK